MMEKSWHSAFAWKKYAEGFIFYGTAIQKYQQRDCILRKQIIKSVDTILNFESDDVGSHKLSFHSFIMAMGFFNNAH